VDDWAIQNATLTYPTDGTFVTDYSTNIVYEVVGGAALRVFNWANVGGGHPTTVVDGWAIQNVLRHTPKDGSYATDYTTGIVYVFAGGAPIRIVSWANVGGAQPAVVADHMSLTALPQYPTSGTFVTDYGTGVVYEFIGDMPLRVVSWANVGGAQPTTVVDDWAIQNAFPSFPAEGTYMVGYQSGYVFQVQNASLVRITSGQPGNITAVDDWSIVNILGGIE
jgi:hypothetical protein